MSRVATSVHLPDPGAHPGAGFATGLLLTAAVVALDAALGGDTVIVTAYLLGPFGAALIGTPRETAGVALVATALALVSGVWNENFGDFDYFVRAAIVAVGGSLALVGALSRVSESIARKRFGLLIAVARVVDDALTLEETVERLNGIIVPGFADVCVVDVIRASELERLSVRAHGPAAERVQEWLSARPPRPIVDTTNGRAQHIQSDLESEVHEHVDELDPDLRRSVAGATAIAVPLRTRGRTMGTITFIVTALSGRHYGATELEFSEALAGRAALALDNAGLFSELTSAEAQLTAALGSLAEAVTVQSRTGELVYANQAAAESLGFESAEELLATPPAEIVSKFESFREDGSPLRMEDLPGRKVLAGEEAEPLVVRAIEKRTGEEKWRVTKATGVRNVRGEVELAVNIIEDVTDVKRAEVAQRLLADVGEVLASSADYERTLQRVAEMAVPELADWCGVSIPDGHGLIRQVAVAHVDPQKIQFAREISERYPQREDAPTGAAAVIRDGRSLLFNEIPEELIVQGAQDAEHLELIRSLGLRAGLVVPMRTGGKTIGALSLVTSESGRTFTEADRELAEELARRAATAVENARLYTERSHIAQTLQRGLLPPRLPAMPGWVSATLYHAAGDENWVGGDFYDVFPVRDEWMVVVGDVVGHGPEAASLTAQARYTLRTASMLTGSPLIALEQLNNELVASDPGMALCTAACVLLREVDGVGRAEVVCAGQPLPLVVRDDRVEAVGRYGPMLGAWGDKTWTPVDVELGPGDTLVLYTDGVVDAEGGEDRFGEGRLEAALAGSRTAEEAVARIDRALSEFEVGAQADDKAVLAVSRTAVSARSPALLESRSDG